MSKAASMPRGRPSKKSTSWTREKIAQLILLYRQHECLWNYCNNGYKNKDLRLKAVANICAKLKVDSNDYSKKIHNLRNQFNSEMKKLNRRIEEVGGDSKTLTVKGCRWEHFDSLSFLTDVIEPRPGSYMTSPYRSMSTNLKNESTYKVEDDEKLIVDVIASEIENYDDGDETTTIGTTTTTTTTMLKDDVLNNSSNFSEEHLATVVITSTETISNNNNNNNTNNNNNINNKNNSLINKQLMKRRRRRKISESMQQQQKQQQQQQQSHHQEEKQLNNFEHTQLPANCSILEVSTIPNTNTNNIKTTERDEWDGFGELVANEFRQLNSDASRKKLKRKIMKSILEVGEEDDI